ncbi:MAG: hypothetical protein ABIQ02_12440, partial [Saprospiraceae bacterium]
MKNSIIILTMLQMLVISNSCISQSGVHGCYGFDCKKKTWYLSFKTGVPILGPANELEKAMIESGFGDSHIHYGGFWGPGGTTEYPQHSNRLNWEFELKHQLNKRSSLAISLGNSWTQSVTGNDEKGFNEIWGQYWGNTLQLKSVARTLT